MPKHTDSVQLSDSMRGIEFCCFISYVVGSYVFVLLHFLPFKHYIWNFEQLIFQKWPTYLGPNVKIQYSLRTITEIMKVERTEIMKVEHTGPECNSKKRTNYWNRPYTLVKVVCLVRNIYFALKPSSSFYFVML